MPGSSGSIYVLADYYGHLHEIENGPLTARTKAIIASFECAAYYEVVPEGDA